MKEKKIGYRQFEKERYIGGGIGKENQFPPPPLLTQNILSFFSFLLQYEEKKLGCLRNALIFLDIADRKRHNALERNLLLLGAVSIFLE